MLPLTLAANPSGHSRYCSKKKSICKTVDRAPTANKAYYLTHEGFIFQSWDRYVMLSRCKVQGETLMCTCSGPHYKPTTYLVLQSVGNSNYRRHFGVQYPQYSISTCSLLRDSLSLLCRCQQKVNIITLVNVEFIAELLYWLRWVVR